MENIILIGGGGHCKSILDTLLEIPNFNVIGIVDTKDKLGKNLSGIEIIGTDSDLEYLFNQGLRKAFISLGSIGDVQLRRKLFISTKKIGYTIPTIIDKTAVVSNKVSLESGTFIGKGAIINSNVKIGENAIINTGTIIEHDCIVGDFCHIAPGSTLSGGIQIGNNTHIGTNSTIIENVSIGRNTLIGAGSVVINDIGDNKKAYGNPCKVV